MRCALSDSDRRTAQHFVQLVDTPGTDYFEVTLSNHPQIEIIEKANRFPLPHTIYFTLQPIHISNKNIIHKQPLRDNNLDALELWFRGKQSQPKRKVGTLV